MPPRRRRFLRARALATGVARQRSHEPQDHDAEPHRAGVEPNAGAVEHDVRDEQYGAAQRDAQLVEQLDHLAIALALLLAAIVGPLLDVPRDPVVPAQMITSHM